MMHVLELPVIGAGKSAKEKIFTALSNEAPRKFHGFNFGELKFENGDAIYFYFLNYEQENYHYFWDLIIPHAVGCIVVYNTEQPEQFENTREMIEILRHRYSVPVHVCVIKGEKEWDDVYLQNRLGLSNNEKILHLRPQDKDSVKRILMKVLDGQ